MDASTALTQAWSIISMAAGTMPAAMIPLTASLAARIEGKAASRVRTAAGSGSRRRVISVAMPNIPSLPTKSPTRSGPHASPLREPSRTSSAFGRRTSSAATWLVVTPYLRQCGPPAFSATLPPSVHALWLEGSGA